MIYSLGSGGMERIDKPANHIYNSLPVGTVLHLNGYSNPDYVIIRNEGVDERFGHGARYQVVSLDDGRFQTKDALGLRHISEKTSDRIQLYVTDEIKPPEEVLDLYEKAKALEDEAKGRKEQAEQVRAALVVKGKEIADKLGIDSAPALIVAEYQKDESDIQTDYFGHTTSQLVILATSKHTRDLFAEMRKAADKFPQTAHLGTGKGIFTACVRFSPETLKERPYIRYSQLGIFDNLKRTFDTRKEAEEYAAAQAIPYASIVEDGFSCSYVWHVSEEAIEHREKYSMGNGYFLIAGNSDSTGWKVRKYKKWSTAWRDDVYISLAQVCILTA